jgi:hypothetical protein
VIGVIAGGINKLNGDYTDDVYGPLGSIALQYSPIKQLAIEARVGVGKGRWLVPESALAAHPEYFGDQAFYGDLYPGSQIVIEKENEVRLSTYDLLLRYVLIDDIRAVPFIYAGVSLLNFVPATADAHESLPNGAIDAYSTSAFSVPVGAGVRIPFSDRVGLELRGEYRFAFTEYLDDVNWNVKNDGITSVSVGLTYSFNAPQEQTMRVYDVTPAASAQAAPQQQRLIVIEKDSVLSSADTAVTLKPDSAATLAAPLAVAAPDTAAPQQPAPMSDTAAAPAARRPECTLLTRTGSQKIKWEAGETILDYNDREVRIRQTLSGSEPVTYMTPVNPDGTYGKEGARIVKVQGYDLKNCEECFDLLFD